MAADLFKTFFYQPLLTVLVFLYHNLPGRDLGLAVIVLTAIIKVVIFPLNAWAFKSQQSFSRIQPRIKEIRQKYKDNSQEQTKMMSEIFKKEKVSPLGSLVPLLIQFPVLIALYQLFWKGLWNNNGLEPLSFGIIDLSLPNVFLAAMAAIIQFFQSRISVSFNKKPGEGKDAQEKISNIMQKQMIFLFPFLTFYILLKLPSALGLYWAANSLLTIFEQKFLKKRYADKN